MSAMAATRDELFEILDGVKDPEVPVLSVVELGIVRDVRMEDGVVTTLNLGDYKLPTMADIPELETVLVPSNLGPAPYEGKAIGELSNVAMPGAVANATKPVSANGIATRRKRETEF